VERRRSGMSADSGKCAACCVEHCLCKREAVFRAHQVHCVEVENEPTHPELFRNEWVRVYAGILAIGNCTLFHRHTRDTLYVTLRDASLLNEYFVDPSLRDAHTKTYRHDARRFEVFGRWHATDQNPLVHRVCYPSDWAKSLADRSASPTTLFIGIEFLAYPEVSPALIVADAVRIESVAEYLQEPSSPRMRLWRLRENLEAIRLPFHCVVIEWSSPLDEHWDTTDLATLMKLTASRVRFVPAGVQQLRVLANTLVVELRSRTDPS
jgi:hypothetical protein